MVHFARFAQWDQIPQGSETYRLKLTLESTKPFQEICLNQIGQWLEAASEPVKYNSQTAVDSLIHSRERLTILSIATETVKPHVR